MKINFDKDWKFFPGDLSPQKPTDDWGGAKARAYFNGVPSEKFDDSKWGAIDLPHDFVSYKEYCFKTSDNAGMRDIPEMESIGSRLFAGGCLEGGIAWYRKKFTIDENLENKRVYIHFDGVYRNSTLYLNEYYIGTHASGYTGFYYDITDFINIGGENIIAMRVDATDREGWWYEGGGIYRHVWLEIADNIHIEPWSVSVESKPDLKTNTAHVKINVGILNRYFGERTVYVETEIKDMEGRSVSEIGKMVNVSEWDSAQYSDSTALNDITLWDIENPYLYSASIRIFDNETVCCEYNVNFGIREIRFDSDKGFFLNGRNIKIKGLCCHHDHAGVGIGVPDSVNEYRISQMKSMGANAVRSSHYPASPELLDICDRLGMLMFEETRRMSAAKEDIECLKAMVKRDRNHPSIFLWGIGNEEIFSQNRTETERTTRTMIAEIKKLDPTRPATSAVVCWDGEGRYDTAEKYVDVTKNLDVMGFNYCPTAWDDYHDRMPNQPVIITEATSNSGTRGCYSTDESKGLYYIFDDENVSKCKSGEKAAKKDIAENMWKMCAERDYLAGIFLWTGMDYRGEPTPLQYPAVYSQFGIFDYCGFEKDNYYYYKSWWQNEDVIHVFPHWNYPVETGEEVNVYCYSNLDEVELFVNDKSYGRKKMEKNWYLTWENVIYEPGELKAIGYKNGQRAAQEIVKTTGEPYSIRLIAYKTEVNVGDTVIINVDIIDENGVVVPTAQNEVQFSISGNGMLSGTGNGNPGDHDSEKLPLRRAFNGKCQLLVKAVTEGEIKITASGKEICNSVCYITVK
ncbi:MAG: DUF4982 domain-containing protein [Oscillospiraceae bacterium]|nr:DUF4982 domain-containing protein [Oscillospiraceae bacterium]